ncbi:ATP-binding cassette domain-containing protein [Nonomuraea purpurea]|uniref:ATP-binding cassette domain-containing protein n=1 Tax=Nonomuraea purpurea TaxID=1849276 RepID=UPI0036D2D0A4
MKRSLTALAVLAVLAAGCSSASGSTDGDVLRFAAVPAEQNIDPTAEYKDIIALIEKNTGKKVEFVRSTDYNAVIEGMVSGAEVAARHGPEHGTSVSPATGAVVAAWDVGFEVEPGEALGVVGESGSGKSTVMRCVAGDERPTLGSAYLRGYDDGRTDVLALGDGERRRLRIDRVSVVYQDPAAGLDLDTSAGGNIAERLTAAGASPLVVL